MELQLQTAEKLLTIKVQPFTPINQIIELILLTYPNYFNESHRNLLRETIQCHYYPKQPGLKLDPSKLFALAQPVEPLVLFLFMNSQTFIGKFIQSFGDLNLI